MPYSVSLQTIPTPCTPPVDNLDLSQITFQASNASVLNFYGLQSNTAIYLSPAGTPPGTLPTDIGLQRVISDASFNQNLVDPTRGTVQINFSPKVVNATIWPSVFVTVVRGALQQTGAGTQSLLPQNYTQTQSGPIDPALIAANVKYATATSTN